MTKAMAFKNKAREVTSLHSHDIQLLAIDWIILPFNSESLVPRALHSFTLSFYLLFFPSLVKSNEAIGKVV